MLKNYWDISYNTISSSWHLSLNSGYPIPGLRFLTPGGGIYEESLTSPYYDATEIDKLYLSFMIGIPDSSIPRTTEQKVSVEVFVDGSWHLLEEIAALNWEPQERWRYKMYDLSAKAANKDNIRIRFRCHGDANGADLNWFLDNVELVDEANRFITEEPLAISTRYVEEEKTVHVNWADPHGFVNLRYMIYDRPEDVMSSIGNEGEPFVAVNKYPAEDLSIYEGYKLTSVSFMRGTNPLVPFIPTDPTFRWFVSQGEERLLNEAVDNPEMGVWKTIELAQPIPIDGTKPLYYGVEITSHDANDWPVATGRAAREEVISGGEIVLIDVPTFDGRGNIFSTDGGNSWKKFSDEPNGNNLDIFLIRATLAKDPTATRKDRLRGYKIFRNGVDLLLDETTLSPLHNLTDTVPLIGEEACYTVQVIYRAITSEGISDCLNINGVGLIQKDNNLKVYPNPIRKNETITVQLRNGTNTVLRMYDSTGRIVKETPAKGASTSIPMNVDPGLYFLRIGDNETVKLIVN